MMKPGEILVLPGKVTQEQWDAIILLINRMGARVREEERAERIGPTALEAYRALRLAREWFGKRGTPMHCDDAMDRIWYAMTQAERDEVNRG